MEIEKDTQRKLAVIIPCYKESKTITSVIGDIPGIVEKIIVVDDQCPESTGKIAEKIDDPRIMVLFHMKNLGVGAAMKSGYRKALELGCDIMVKIDGDGQMDSSFLGRLIAPIVNHEADYTKGNRFHDFPDLKKMPRMRLIGNSLLSFLTKIISGYWNILDPTNGYTAISRDALEKIDLNKVADCFFFENDMLINLNIARCVVRDVPMPSRYPDEGKSSLKITRTLRDFPLKFIMGFFRRIFYRYFIYDFNMVSIYLIVGAPLFFFGFFLGIYHWADSIISGVPRTSGTIMLVALPIILGFQMLLQAGSLDIADVPVKNSKD